MEIEKISLEERLNFSYESFCNDQSDNNLLNFSLALADAMWLYAEVCDMEGMERIFQKFVSLDAFNKCYSINERLAVLFYDFCKTCKIQRRCNICSSRLFCLQELMYIYHL